MKKSYVNSQCDPIKKTIKAQLITIFFPNNILQHRFVLKHQQTDRQLRLRTFEYIEADKEIHRKWIAKSKQYSTTLHVSVSDYFTYSIIICRSLSLYVILSSARHKTSQNKKIIDITWKVLWGPFVPKRK
jgi:hypothetical protein